MDRLFSILSAERNRLVLHYFRESSENVVSLEELADYVATRRNETDSERVATLLHHSSLPKLAEIAIIDYDPRQNTVKYWGHPVLKEGSAPVTEM